MTTIQIISMVVAALITATQFIGATKDFWSKIPVLLKFVPAVLPVAALVVEKLQGVKTESDLLPVGSALVLALVALFTGKKDGAPKV